MRLKFPLIGALVLGLVFGLEWSPPSAQADVYRYRDERGAVHYVETLERVPEKFRPTAEKAGSSAAFTRLPAAAAGYQVPASAPAPSVARNNAKVDIFVTSWCPHCRRLEAFLKRHQVNHTSYDIEKNSRGRKEYISLGGDGSVPVIRIGNKVLRGFDEGTLAGELDIDR